MIDPSRRMLILDFDGVLVDTEPVHFDAWNKAFDELMNIRLEGDYTQLVGMTLDEIYQRWAAVRPGTFESLTAELRKQVLDRKTEHFFAMCEGQLEPMPGVVDLIRQAQKGGWYIGIASRAKRLRLHRTLEMIGIPPAFDVVLGIENAVDVATDRKVHARAALMLNIDPAHCVVVEDSPSGVAAAIDCGIGHVIGFVHAIDRHALLAAGAHQVVENLTEIELR